MVLVYLTPEDYHVNRDSKLCNNIPDFSFIFFTSDQCKHCKDIEPDFLRLSRSINGCVFGIMNVDQNNQKIVNISLRSITPLEYVPYIILYRNGIPVAQFVPDESNQEWNLANMKTFIVKYTSKRDNTMSNPQPAVPEIPPYSIGRPCNAEKVCYLKYDDAYKSKS